MRQLVKLQDGRPGDYLFSQGNADRVLITARKEIRRDGHLIGILYRLDTVGRAQYLMLMIRGPRNKISSVHQIGEIAFTLPRPFDLLMRMNEIRYRGFRMCAEEGSPRIGLATSSVEQFSASRAITWLTFTGANSVLHFLREGSRLRVFLGLQIENSKYFQIFRGDRP